MAIIYNPLIVRNEILASRVDGAHSAKVDNTSQRETDNRGSWAFIFHHPSLSNSDQLDNTATMDECENK